MGIRSDNFSLSIVLEVEVVRNPWTLVVCTLLLASTAHAGGFNIYEMGARATALGGAFTATADDGSAIFYNPAGLAWLDEGWHVSGNLSLVMPGSKLAMAEGNAVQWPGNQTAETKAAIFPPSGLYASYRYNEEWAFGFGVFTPFGLGVEWDDPDNFPGRSIASNSQVQSFYLSPVITWRPASGIALSAGAHAVISHLTLERIITVGTDLSIPADFELEGSSNVAFGPAFAMMLRPNDRFSFGINFKGAVTNEFEDQDASLDSRGQLAALDIETTVNGDLDFPSILAVGTRLALSDAFDFMVDYVFFDWSVFSEVVLDFAEGIPDAVIDEGYVDGHQWRIGGEYQHSPKLSFMGGFVYDMTPQPRFSMGPLLPDADRRDYSLGFTYRTDNGYEFTGAYMLVDFLERSSLINGVGQNPEGFDANYRSIAHIPTFGVSKSF